MDAKSIKIDLEKDIKKKSFQFGLKRLIDIVLSFIGIVMLIPIYIIVYIAIKIDSKGPAIFKQVRVGKDNVPFKIYKFRTMVVNAEKKDLLKLKLKILKILFFKVKAIIE